MNSELRGKKKKRGFKRFLDSFKYSFEGLAYAYLNEQSMFLHFIASGLVILMGLYFKITITEWILTFVMIGIVMGTELLNTAIEAVVDLVSPEKHYLAKIAKDTASASVFIYSLIAAIVGLMVYVPYIIELIGW